MKRCSAVVVSLFLAVTAAWSQSDRHPLDPLTFEEHWRTLEVLHEGGHFGEGVRVPVLQLALPEKAQVLDWQSRGQAVPRRAFAVLGHAPEEDGGKSTGYEAIVDLDRGEVESLTKLEGVHIPWSGGDFGGVQAELREHPEVKKALERRGIEDWTFLSCFTGPPGYFGTKEEVGRRLGNVGCTDERGARNTWGRGVQGFRVIVDLDTKEVLRVVDEDIVPIPATKSDFDAASVGEMRAPSAVRVSQPNGPGYTLKGHAVEWQNWSFHVRPDQRIGPVLSLVSYKDGEDSRSVLFEGHLSEIFVPYMDPSSGWYHRNFIDAGEYVAGSLIKGLLAGRDCPDYATMFDLTIPGGAGKPVVLPDVMCVFERSAGNMAWRHLHGQRGLAESRPETDLVVRSSATIGNYDYILDWVFKQSGSIEVGVGATGIVEAKPTRARGRNTEVAGTPAARGFDVSRSDDADDAYGRFVDDHVVAVNHDHYFSYRLDLDVDGPENSLLVDRLQQKILPKDHPRRSVWVVESEIAQTEADARLNLDMKRPKLWRIASTHATNKVGYPTSYQIKPGRNASTLLSEDDMPRKRAGFIEHHLWVTPYAADERYAAGAYPTLSTPGMGLPAWSKERPIESSDVVVWHTVGMHHVVRAEDWPVMPVMWHTFELRPFDFFDGNPALDVPE